MNAKETFLYRDECFTVLMCEKGRLFNPSMFGMKSFHYTPLESLSSATYYLDDYELFLNSFSIESNCMFQLINGVKPEYQENSELLFYQDVNESLRFSGGIVIANKLIDSYGYDLSEVYPCFCYEKVLELIFHNGTLITTIDHSKAMLRIRKNLDRGFRSVDISKDSRCIQRYIRSTFIGKYRPTILRKMMKRIIKSK